MKRFYGFTALVATLIILTNVFAQQPMTYSTPSPNSPLTEKFLERKNIEERTETTFTVEKPKSPSILHKDEHKMITRKSSKTSLTTRQTKYTRVTTQVPTQLLLMNVYSVTTTQSQNPGTDQNPSENYVKLPKFEFTAVADKGQKKINDFNISESFISQNYTNDRLTDFETKFQKLPQSNSEVYNKFDHIAVQVATEEKEKIPVLSVIENGNGEMYTHTSNYRTFQEFNSKRSTKDNVDSQKVLSPTKLNQPNADQSLFTIKKFPQSKFVSSVTTDSTVANSQEITLNVVLNKQIQSGKTFLPQTVNRNSEIPLSTIVNKDSTNGEVGNLFHGASKFQSEIGLLAHKENLFKKVKDNLKLRDENSFVSTLLKSEEMKIDTRNSSDNKLCKISHFDHDIELNRFGNKLPLKSMSSMGKIEEKFSKNLKSNFPKTLKFESIKRKLCKVSSYIPKYKSSQVDKKRNSEILRKLRITLFKFLPTKMSNNNFKSLLTTIIPELGNKNIFPNNSFMKKDKIKKRDKKGDTTNDVSRIMKGPRGLISKGKFNYSHGKTKRGQVLKSVLTPSDNATQNSLKDHLKYASAFNDKENSSEIFEKYLPKEIKEEGKFSGIIFSNSSSDLRNEEWVGVGTDPNFIAGQIRNYSLDKETSNLEDEAIKSNSSITNESTSKINETNNNYYNFYQTSKIEHIFKNETSEESLDKSLDKIVRLNSGLILRMNPTENYFNESIIREEENEENLTKVATPVNLWPVKHSAVVEGDLVLGGLMMVHEREDTITCGPVMPQGGVQALEAMLYTLDRLNEQEIVPGVKIGAHILDDCDKDTYGLEMAVDFIKGRKIIWKNNFTPHLFFM